MFLVIRNRQIDKATELYTGGIEKFSAKENFWKLLRVSRA